MALEKQHKTITTIRKSLEDSKDFPAMSQTIKILNQQNSKDLTISELTDTILQDFGLTNKLLQMVNSVNYIRAHIDGKINTVSRAVYVLGLTHIRNAAISLLLFESLKDKALADELKQAIVNRFISGVIAREMAKAQNVKEAEEAFLCAMFHDFGELLTIYFLQEERKKINNIVEQRRMNEKDAVNHVLG
ncbi:signal transduction protein, partial [Candidatus Magnetoovum chiemensis]